MLDFCLLFAIRLSNAAKNRYWTKQDRPEAEILSIVGVNLSQRKKLA